MYHFHRDKDPFLVPPAALDRTRPSPAKTSLEDEMRKAEQRGGEEGDRQEEKVEAVGEKGGEQGEEDGDRDSLEWELRNTESVFSELSELSRDYVESVDQGASVRGWRLHKHSVSLVTP